MRYVFYRGCAKTVGNFRIASCQPEQLFGHICVMMLPSKQNTGCVLGAMWQPGWSSSFAEQVVAAFQSSSPICGYTPGMLERNDARPFSEMCATGVIFTESDLW